MSSEVTPGARSSGDGCRYSAPGLTMFWEGYVTDLRGCIPLEVRTSAASQPLRVTISGAGCDSSA